MNESSQNTNEEIKNNASKVEQNTQPVQQNTSNIVIPKSLQGGAQTEPVPIIVDPYTQAKMDKESASIGKKDNSRMYIVAILVVVILVIAGGAIFLIKNNMSSNNKVINDNKVNSIEENPQKDEDKDKDKDEEKNNGISSIEDDEKSVIVDGEYTDKLQNLNDAINNLNVNYDDYDIKSTIVDNKMVIDVLYKEQTMQYETSLNSNVLTLKDNVSDNNIDAFIVFKYIAIAKGISDGNNYLDVLLQLQDETIKDMTLKNNGLRIYSDNSTWIGKIDLANKFNFIDISRKYINKEDLDFDKYNTERKLSGSVGFIKYDISNNDDNIKIVLVEKNEFTNKTYNSLINIISLLLGHDEAISFKEKYVDIKDASFDNYSIKVNDSKEEYKSYYDMKYVVLEIIVTK